MGKTNDNNGIISKILSADNPDLLGKQNYLVSAVMIPLIESNNGTSVLFEVRSLQLDRQPGEICFPGGRVEKTELADPGAAALREAEEELGLRDGDLRLLAPLDYLVTPMGTVVYPYVGQILRPERMVPNAEEVQRIFTVPLSFLTANPPRVSEVEVATRYGNGFPEHRVPEIYRGGWKKRWSFPTYIFEYENHFIWGMTAIILQHFLEKINR